jgi:hypothetical protein
MFYFYDCHAEFCAELLYKEGNIITSDPMSILLLKMSGKCTVSVYMCTRRKETKS